MNFLTLFKRKKEHSFGWEDLTVEKFNEIIAITKDDKPSKELRIKHLIFGDNEGSILFLNQEIPTVEYRKHYTLNGRKYYLSARYDRMTTSQFVDFTTCGQNHEKLSAVLIPQGHKYNDGYDIDLVKHDILSMKMTDYRAIANFLVRQSQVLLLLMEGSSEKVMTRLTSLTPLKSITSNTMESLLELTEYVRSAMKNTQI